MTSKSKNIFLTVGFILSLIICYNLAFSKTIVLKRTYNDLMIKENPHKNTSETLSILKQKEHYYDSLLTRYRLNEGSNQNTLLKTINSFAENNNLKVVSFLEPHRIISEDMIIKSYQFSLEGNYNEIINLIYKLEQEFKFGEIVNVHFEKKKNFKTNKDYLQVSIILTSIG